VLYMWPKFSCVKTVNLVPISVTIMEIMNFSQEIVFFYWRTLYINTSKYWHTLTAGIRHAKKLTCNVYRHSTFTTSTAPSNCPTSSPSQKQQSSLGGAIKRMVHRLKLTVIHADTSVLCCVRWCC